jgi:PHD/YefM family antitoxin component YafN of YafNO toxin-antitoxin module
MSNLSLNEQYLVDKDGRRVGVVLTLQAYQKLMDRLDELEAFQSAREEINIVDQLLAEARQGEPEESLPTFRRRQGPGGMVVI